MAVILITGGTGLIGSALTEAWLQKDNDVLILSRHRARHRHRFPERVTLLPNLQAIPAHQKIDIVVNLAGAPIASRRWSAKRKQQLYESRITYTQELVAWLSQRTTKPDTLISGSAVGWYGDQGATILDELSSANTGFTHTLCADWEQAANRAVEFGIRVVIVRTGLVLSPQGGFLSRLLPVFRLGLGGRVGDGKQFMPWIHLTDICHLILFLADQPNARGVFNGSAPLPVTNQVFTDTLSAILKKPAILPMPACLLKGMLGEMATLLLDSQRALPEKAQASGYQFHYTDLTAALANVVKKTKK
ncbi:Cell division inhibitor [Methylophaga frappieri]|uniref:Cell division inhibitor n=1 Tax=Methylophaga frappieri (strain ATCC BAA-2434 / DSM 25690 / JAM7) TaxID=754477 RepID=I1YI56_METFJ|nr:TIGR01777 family oxidoreductase [Methylophaga frappieri]AFJ02599.1 Cell division inhibitor [Methylophaga frappieri]